MQIKLMLGDHFLTLGFDYKPVNWGTHPVGDALERGSLILDCREHT